LTLTGNVTSSTLSNAVAGEPLAFEICQDAIGGRTFVPPANVQGWLPISSAANACNLEVFDFDGSNAQPDLVAGLTGDVTSSPGSTVTTVAKVNGVSFPSSPSTHAVPVTTATNVETYKVVPDCQDSTGNHLNYTQSSDTFSCGTSISANVLTTTNTASVSGKSFTDTVSFNRFRANQGGALATSNVGSLTGWGSTATVASVSGTDSIGFITITSSGTGQTINPGFTLTFHDGAWPSAPLCGVQRADGFAPSGYMVANGPSTTAVNFFFNATPVAGTTYSALFFCIGR
jgi:hypothetical protein